MDAVIVLLVKSEFSPVDPSTEDDGVEDDGAAREGVVFVVAPTAPPTTAPITTTMIPMMVMIPLRLRQKLVRGFEASTNCSLGAFSAPAST